MNAQDITVGAVAVIFGVALLAGAAMNGPWLMQLAKARLLAGSIGATAARLLFAAVGIGLIVLGIAIASGWRINWT